MKKYPHAGVAGSLISGKLINGNLKALAQSLEFECPTARDFFAGQGKNSQES